MKSIQTLILEASAHLKEQGVADPEREARLLMAFALDKDASFLRGHPEYILNGDERALFFESVNRRGHREPFQHIVGKQEFYGIEFVVNRHVLVPRPETELIVETALGEFSDRSDTVFCDVGTGSGCIGLSILSHLPGSLCVGIDISESAIAVAIKNAREHILDDRFLGVVSDVFEAFRAEPVFDLIVANPPYVPKADLAGLQTEVRSFDPEVALTDGADGISIIRKIEQSAFERLKNPGLLVMEIGYSQAESVTAIFAGGLWSSFEFMTDLRGISRVICAKKTL